MRRVERIKRIEFDPSVSRARYPAYYQPTDRAPFQEALVSALLDEQARKLKLDEDDTDYFVYMGKEWAREHLGLFKS